MLQRSRRTVGRRPVVTSTNGRSQSRACTANKTCRLSPGSAVAGCALSLGAALDCDRDIEHLDDPDGAIRLADVRMVRTNGTHARRCLASWVLDVVVPAGYRPGRGCSVAVYRVGKGVELGQ